MTHTSKSWNCYPNVGFPEEFRVYDGNDNWITEDEDERKEIAHIISAAPDLLDVVREFLACGQNAGHNEELKLMAIRAIAKATGETK